jgi:hypothetical protein
MKHYDSYAEYREALIAEFIKQGKKTKEEIEEYVTDSEADWEDYWAIDSSESGLKFLVRDDITHWECD